MDRAKEKVSARSRVRTRVRKKIAGTATRPRLTVFKSLHHIYAQAIDDEAGVTLAAASSKDESIVKRVKGSNVAAAKEVGALIADRIREKGIEQVVFDRSGYPYHGKVKALADAAREKGLKF